MLATYDGYERELCPHVLGLAKDGTEQALCYQFGGGSKRGLAPPGSAQNWRCLVLERLTEASIRAGKWHSAPNFANPQVCVAVVDVEVTP